MRTFAPSRFTADTAGFGKELQRRRVGALSPEERNDTGGRECGYAAPHGRHYEDHDRSAGAGKLRSSGDRFRSGGMHRDRGLVAVSEGRGTVYRKLLWQCEGVIGGKTGYTRAAGRCLVFVCTREGLELVCVTLNDREDWEDHAALYEEAYAARKLWRVGAGEILSYVPVMGKGRAAVSAGDDCSLCIRGEKRERVRGAAGSPLCIRYAAAGRTCPRGYAPLERRREKAAPPLGSG